jgi:hypothetical protein
VSPAGGPGAPEATSVDSGAPEDDEEGAGAA